MAKDTYIRVSPAMHRTAKIQAAQRGTTLGAMTEAALKLYLDGIKPVPCSAVPSLSSDMLASIRSAAGQITEALRGIEEDAGIHEGPGGSGGGPAKPHPRKVRAASPG